MNNETLWHSILDYCQCLFALKKVKIYKIGKLN